MFVTPLFAAIYGLLYVLMAFNVIRFRISGQVLLGDGDHPELLKAIRVHANFAEYVPLALLLMWFLESMTFASQEVFWLGSILLMGRILHVFGMMYPKNFLILRQLGMIATFAVILKSCISLFLHYLPVAL